MLTPDEARRVIALMDGAAQLVVKLLYGSGLPLMEALRVRVKDVDFKMLSVTQGCGDDADIDSLVPTRSALRAFRPGSKFLLRFPKSK